MSDNTSQFGQKVVQSIYNPNNEENEIKNKECSSMDNGEGNEGGNSKFKTQEVSLLHSLTSMAYKAVNISTFTKNNISNNVKNIDINGNDTDDNNNVTNDINNDNINYSVNKTSNSSNANLLMNNKLTSTINRCNIGNNGIGNENISGIHTQVPHLLLSTGPGSSLNHTVSKHNTPRDYLGKFFMYILNYPTIMFKLYFSTVCSWSLSL